MEQQQKTAERFSEVTGLLSDADAVGGSDCP